MLTIIILMALVLFLLTPISVLIFDLWVYTLFNYHPAPFNNDQFGASMIFVFIALAILPVLASKLDDYRTKKILDGSK
jgi:hypothetical protein